MSSFVYAKNWHKTCKKTVAILPLCTCNPLHKDKIVIHHLKYKRSLLRRFLGMFLLHNPLKVSVSGYEIPGWDVIPVCEKCHENSYGRSLSKRSVHNTSVWIQKGGLNNHNKLFFAMKLRLKFLIFGLLFLPFKICSYRK
jgi:hypothetical protein